jgi:outer membrane protein TolC
MQIEKMKHYTCSVILCILIMLSADFTVKAQKGSSFDLYKDDISDRLPALNILIDSALTNHPAVRYSDLQIAVNKGNLKTSRSEWTQNFGLQANYGYGTFDYLYNSTAGGQTPPTYTLSQSLSQYGVGAYLRIPISDVVNHHNLVKTAKAEVSQAEALAESQRMQIRELVIRQYNDLVMKQRLLRIKSKYLETARINTQMAEKGFTSGNVTIDDYSQVSEIESRTESDFESTKMEFLTSYMMLEEVTGMKFNIIHNETQNQ